MTSTDQLEKFIDFLNFPEYISFLYDRAAVDKYIQHAGKLFANLVKEARENRAELNLTGGDTNRYFKDLNKKVDFNRKGAFDTRNGEIFHKTSRIKLGDETADPYSLLNYIYDSYDSAKEHFEELSATVSSFSRPKKSETTFFPSFTVKHNSTAYSLHKGLKQLGYISCDLKTFLDAFTGMEVTTRIQWLRANSHLAHLIKRLCSEGLVNDPGNDDRWPLTIKVFIKPENIEFKREKLSHSSSDVRIKGVPELDKLIDEIKSRGRK